MKKIVQLVSAATVVAGMSLTAAPAAHAGGWIADNIIKPVFGSHAAREADKLHEKAGKPLDKAIPAIVGVAVGG